MANTPNLGLTLLQAGQLQPEVVVNGNMEIIDQVIGSASSFGYNAGSTTGLTYGYYGGSIYENGVGIVKANGTVQLAASKINYIQRTPGGTVSVNQTGFTAGYIPMATVVTGVSTITSVVDKRPAYYTRGGILSISVGSPTGEAVATAATGGTLAASTAYGYQLASVYPWGESAPTAPVSVTTGSTSTNKNTITWANPSGSTGTKVYGRVAGSIALIATLAAGVTSYTDTGSVTPSGALPIGDITLSEAQTNASILDFSGTLTGATQVTLPSRSQVWVIAGNTTGDALTFTTSGATLPPVPVSGGLSEVLYVTTSGVVAAGSQVTSFNSRTGAVTLARGDVTEALGYTPPNPAAAWTQNPGAGTNNQTPFLQAGDMIGAYVVSGLLDTVPSTASLTSTMPGGVAYVQGGSVLQRVVSPGATNAYAASSDTYVDLSYSGVFTYSAVANGATAPAVAADSLRLEKVVTSATAITGVTQLAYTRAPYGSPLLEVTSTYSANSLTLATSTTGGSIAASTAKYYLVLTTLASGEQMAYVLMIQGITTGSTTSTNSNTISWPAAAGAVSYSVYEGPGSTVSDLPSFGLIGTTTSTSFVDTGITPGAQVPGGVSGAFTVIPFSVVQQDTANGWNASGNYYTIPATGFWLVKSSLRYQDDSPVGISYSLNADSTVTDSPSDQWFMTSTPASGQTARQGASNFRLAYFTAGEQISMFSYAGSHLTAQAAAFSLYYLGA